MTRVPCRRRIGEAVPRAEKFGDLITADHKVLNEGCESRDNHQFAVVVQDLATQRIQSHPCKAKTYQETEKSSRTFLEPKVISFDSSSNFGKSCEDLSWNHRTSTPHRSETNGIAEIAVQRVKEGTSPVQSTLPQRSETSWIAERAVRRVKEGTSAVLLQSGLDEKWWADSMECYCYLRNVQNLLADGKTPCERRFGAPL